MTTPSPAACDTLEARFARDPLGCERIGLRLQRAKSAARAPSLNAAHLRWRAVGESIRTIAARLDGMDPTRR